MAHAEVAAPTDGGIVQPGLVQLLEHVAGAQASAFHRMGADGRPGEIVGVSVPVGQDAVVALLSQLRPTFAEHGYLLFWSEQRFGAGLDRVAVIQTDDPYDMLRVQQTNAGYYDITTESIIERLKTWQARYPFTLLGAGFDWVEAELLESPGHPEALARSVALFAPDVVKQGTGTVEKLARGIEHTRRLYLWWD